MGGSDGYPPGMLISSSAATPYRLGLRRPWLTHRGRLDHRDGWLIRLAADGCYGVGDCAPLTMTGTETLAVAGQWLAQHISGLCRQEAMPLLEQLDSLHSPPAVRCGIESALIDLLSRQAGISVARWLNPDALERVEVNANLGSLDQQTSDRLAQATGYPVVKLKLGIASPEEELVWLNQLVPALPAGVRLRLDANQGWSYHQASQFILACATLPIESIEEPLCDPDCKQLYRLQQLTDIPLALDESLTRLDLEKLWQHPPVRRITLKPMVLGGLLPSFRLAQRCHQAGIDAIVTTTIDSAIGVWAATALAAALGRPGAGLAHGLATSRWLTNDVAEPPQIEQGVITLNHSPLQDLKR